MSIDFLPVFWFRPVGGTAIKLVYNYECVSVLKAVCFSLNTQNVCVAPASGFYQQQIL